MCCSNSTLYFPLIKAWMKWNPWGAFVKHLLWCGWRWRDSVTIGGRRRARKGKPGGVASQESHALTGNPEMQHKRWPPLPGITRPKLCWFQSSTLWIVLAFFCPTPLAPHCRIGWFSVWSFWHKSLLTDSGMKWIDHKTSWHAQLSTSELQTQLHVYGAVDSDPLSSLPS